MSSRIFRVTGPPGVERSKMGRMYRKVDTEVMDACRLDVQPGDKVVVTVPGRINPRVHDYLRSMFAEQELVVLEGGAQLEVVARSLGTSR